MRFVKLFFLCGLTLIQCYPDGSPGCKRDVPNHGKNKARTGKAPYILLATAPKGLANGDKSVTITITGVQGTNFKGFYVTARAPNSSENIGKFTAPANAKLLQCKPSTNAITHKDNSDKSSISFTWTAPKKFKGLVEFRATIVKKYKEFYTNIRSPQVAIS